MLRQHQNQETYPEFVFQALSQELQSHSHTVARQLTRYLASLKQSLTKLILASGSFRAFLCHFEIFPQFFVLRYESHYRRGFNSEFTVLK